MNEIAVRQGATLPEKIEYARFLAKSGLLPRSYQDHPENILYAYEYGELLGLHPMAAIAGIHVIDGKPSISAGLMSALVRRAGHRIRVQGDGERARCQIVRSDDPGFTYSAVWDMARAKQAGLLSKSNWQHYPAAMLKSRCVSECCRDACQEVLLGMQYTPDELGADDDGGEVIHDGFPAAPDGRLELHQMSEEEKDAAGVMTRPQRVEHDGLRRENEAPAGAVAVAGEVDPGDPWASPDDVPAPQGTMPSKAAHEKLTNLLASLQLGKRADELALIDWLTGRTDPATALTRGQVQLVTSFLEDALKAAGGDTAQASDDIWAQYKASTSGPGPSPEPA